MDYQFAGWTRPKLIAFLKERDFCASTLTKGQLVKLATQAHELQVPLVEADDSEDCEERFRSVGENFQLKIKLPCDKDFSEDLTHLPQLELGDVFVYLLSMCQWSAARLKNRKSDDGYLLFKALHIDKVMTTKVSTTLSMTIGLLISKTLFTQVCSDEHGQPLPTPVYVLRAECKPQTRQRDKPYLPTIIIEESGTVNSGKCTCPA
jgi:hypothetical protein